MRTFIAAMAGTALFSSPVFATTAPIPVSEPSILSLLAVGVAGIVIARRLRNRK